MGAICAPRRRSTTTKRRHTHSSNSNSSCWRHPLVVFCLCFAILGSLRFRVPARSQPVASHLLQQKRRFEKQQRNDQQRNHPRYPGKRKSNSNIYIKSYRGYIRSNKDNSTDASSEATYRYSSMTKTVNSSWPSIVYQLVADDNNETRFSTNLLPLLSYQRYKALDSSTMEPVSMFQWASRLVSTSDDDQDPSIVLLQQAIASSPYDAVFFETPPVHTMSLSSSSLSTSKDQQPFEFVLVDAPRLHAFATNRPDRQTFSAQLSQTTPSPDGVVFANLGGDATLIAPKPALLLETEPNNNQNNKNNSMNCYAHLASFVRTAPSRQVAALWRMAAQAWLDRIVVDVVPDKEQPLVAATATVDSTNINNNTSATATNGNSNRAVWFSTSGLGIAWLHFRLDSTPKYYSFAPYKQQQTTPRTT